MVPPAWYSLRGCLEYRRRTSDRPNPRISSPAPWPMKSTKRPNRKRMSWGVSGDLRVQFRWGLSTRNPARVCSMEPTTPGTPALGGLRPPQLPQLACAIARGFCREKEKGAGSWNRRPEMGRLFIRFSASQWHGGGSDRSDEARTGGNEIYGR